jgi:Putative prokaryotic signal transducing protein
MDETDVPVVVFTGDYTEALFLKSLLESAGLETTLPESFMGGAQGRLYVFQGDASKAREIIEDFRQHGKRTGVQPKAADVIKGPWPDPSSD